MVISKNISLWAVPLFIISCVWKRTVESEGSTFMPAMAVLGIAVPCATIRDQPNTFFIFFKAVLRIRIRIRMFLGLLDPDPDPLVRMFWGLLDPDPDPLVRYGSWSFYHQAKIVRKPLIPTALWLLFDFWSLKNDLNVPSKGNKQKNFFLVFVASWRSMTKIAGRIH